MKETRSCSLVLPQPSSRQNIFGLPPNAGLVLLLTAAAIALLLLAGCSTRKPAGMTVAGASPLAEDGRVPLGTIALVPDPKPARFSYDKAKGQIAYASDWAGAAAGNTLGKSTGEPILDLPVGVATFLCSPVAAAKGAIDARKRLSPDKLAECETNLLNAMSEMAMQQRFHDLLIRTANEQCQGRLVSLEKCKETGSGRLPPESVLEARVEELRLERTGSSDTSYRLCIKTRTRLVRTADGALLDDHLAEYRSGTCLFADWTLHDAFQSVAETGYGQLAEQCVNRLLLSSEHPVLAGAGYRQAPASNPRGAVPLACYQAPASSPRAQLVSLSTADAGALGIYSTSTVAHVVIQRPLTRDEAVSEALSDVDYMFDGLNQHPNMLVALPASAAAIPVSLWKQSVAAVRGLSPKTVQEAEAILAEAANQTRPHEELAFQVAQQLAPQISQPVVLVRQSAVPGAEGEATFIQCAARSTLAPLAGRQTSGAYLLSQGAATALEIHVESATLAADAGINPKLALCVEARATLFRSRAGQQLFSCPVHYRSQARRFTEWAARDAKLFREELQKCYHDLSARMVVQLVNRGVLPPDRKAQPTFAGN